MNNAINFFINEWLVILVFIALVVVLCLAVYRFLKMPTDEQLASVREWLLWAVTEAEKELGGGTGRLKLRQVYDMFVVRFPWLARIVSFETFSAWVDEALDEMRSLLKTNEAIQEYVEGDLR